MDPPHGGSVVVCVYLLNCTVCESVFIIKHMTAQLGTIKLIFQRYSNGSTLWDIMRIGNRLSIDTRDVPIDMADRDRRFFIDRFE